MFRNRTALAVLVALAILPLVGCANWRCCRPASYSARPVYSAPACSSCPTTSGSTPIIVGG